jgi:hypothetical protein
LLLLLITITTMPSPLWRNGNQWQPMPHYQHPLILILMYCAYRLLCASKSLRCLNFIYCTLYLWTSFQVKWKDLLCLKTGRTYRHRLYTVGVKSSHSYYLAISVCLELPKVRTG